jgi:hypothetical protein
MSVSAITTTLSGLADAFSASGAAVTPAGGPSGKAVVALPDTRTAIICSPLGLKPSRSARGSVAMLTRCAGMSPAWLLDLMSGSILSFVPATALKLPAVIM